MERFDFKVIRNELESLLVAVGNHLEREWPAKYADVNSGQMTILQFVRVAVNYFRTISFICADVDDGCPRKLILVLSVPPLNRSILEIIVSVLYLLEDLRNHTDEFYRAGWRTEQEKLVQTQRDYGGITKWDEFIDKKTAYLPKMEKASNITPEEKQNPSLVRYWRVSKLIDRLKKANAEVAPFLVYLDDWWYRELSEESHLEASGLSRIGLHFLGADDKRGIVGDDWEEKLDKKLVEIRSKQVWIAIIFLTSLISEIEIHFRYGLEPRLAFVWTMIIEGSEIAKEIYEKRYEGLLSPNLENTNG